ncbi:hypothetical protein [Yoonia sp. SS1-5]|uniref:Uncharacterized protein n=1 Tax=Yoonia rhodophyticola TaxID=3137370 RepID=A0AAN0NJP6_9RHOB
MITLNDDGTWDLNPDGLDGEQRLQVVTAILASPKIDAEERSAMLDTIGLDKEAQTDLDLYAGNGDGILDWQDAELITVANDREVTMTGDGIFLAPDAEQSSNDEDNGKSVGRPIGRMLRYNSRHRDTAPVQPGPTPPFEKERRMPVRGRAFDPRTGLPRPYEQIFFDENGDGQYNAGEISTITDSNGN